MVKSPLLAALALVVLAFVPSPARGAELLANGGFEAGIDGWLVTRGQLDSVDGPVAEGTQSGRLTGSDIQIHEIYQVVTIAPGGGYEFSGKLLFDDPDIRYAFVRIRWLNPVGGEEQTTDYPWQTTTFGDYLSVSTGHISAPDRASSARIGVAVVADGAFAIYLDDFSFSGAPAPPVTPSPSPSVAPATPASTPTPSPRPATPTRTPKPTLGPSAPTGEVEPEVFDRLTNAGFERTRGDGTPYGWRDVGALLSTVGTPRVEGDGALAVVSRSASTKWAYQTVGVTAGSWYEGGAWALAGGAEQAFLRLSWYATADGSGAAIESVDSSEIARQDSGRFVWLTTGPAQAPSGAQTVKVRLMMRPGSEDSETAYFDAVSLEHVAPALGVPEGGPARAGPGMISSGRVLPLAGPAKSTGAEAAAVVAATPFVFANVQPAAAPAMPAVSAAGGGYQWLAYVGVATALVATGYAGATELARRRSRGRD